MAYYKHEGPFQWPRGWLVSNYNVSAGGMGAFVLAVFHKLEISTRTKKIRECCSCLKRSTDDDDVRATGLCVPQGFSVLTSCTHTLRTTTKHVPLNRKCLQGIIIVCMHTQSFYCTMNDAWCWALIRFLHASQIYGRSFVGSSVLKDPLVVRSISRLHHSVCI